MTKAEVLLWLRLKTLRAYGFHLRRQAPFRDYYLDFVCFDRRLVIELDGWRHDDPVNAEHDRVRDRVLEREGFTVLRFRNRELDDNIEGVMAVIHSALSVRSPTPAATRPAPPHEGEG